MAKKKSSKKKIGARAGAAMHRAGGAALGAHHRGKKVAKGFAKRKPTSKPKKRKSKKKGKKRAARKAKGAGKPFRTKVQLGRRKASVKCPPGSILVETGVARKDKSGRKHTTVMATCVRGRIAR